MRSDKVHSKIDTPNLALFGCLLGCLLAFVMASEARASALFAPPAAYAAGDSPEAVAVADLDGDTVADIVTANSFSDDVSVLLGNGDGSFQAAVSYTAGNSPQAVAVADLDGDTVPDVVTANRFTSDLSVLLGNGDGSFQAAVSYPTDTRAAGVAVGDLNGDTVPDLVSANQIGDNASVLLGVGDGTFLAAISYPAGNSPFAVAVADFDGDTALDVVTANGADDNVTVLLGNGNGTLQAPVSYAAGDLPRSVAAVDVDGDTVADLVTANSFSDDVSVLLGNGDGTFQAAVSYAAGDMPRSVAVADLDADGVPDLVTANTSSDDVSVLLGNGDGTFQAAESCPAGDSPRSVAVGDLDVDTVPDVASANGLSDDVTVFLNLTDPPTAPAIVSFGRQAALPDTEAKSGTVVTIGDGLDLGTDTLAFDVLTLLGFDEDLDAIHFLPNGNVLFSAEPWMFDVPDVGNVTPGDIIEYDPIADTFSVFFSANNFVGLGNVDACTILPNGNLLLSSKGPAELPGIGPFEDGDLVEWDEDSGTASLFLAESSIFTAGANNSVDALHHTGDTVLISPRTDGIGELGSNGLPYGMDLSDVYEIDLGTGAASPFINGHSLWDSGNTRQIDAVTLEPPPENGKNGLQNRKNRLRSSREVR